MGWLFTKDASKTDLVADLTKEENGEATEWSNKDQKSIPLGYRYTRRTLEWSLRGNVLWTVVEVTAHKNPDEVHRFIGCNLLSKERGFGWGNKSMSECVHPYYYSCPLKFLNMVPTVACQTWRDKVREYHNQRRKVKVCKSLT